ncbi:hypothetical protein GALL_143530 [mine drainage metagenome]|uniref:DUF3306 domain-containing protein n=1 Tax=mine drainage metagenome TaxID=410659 RepID=A0A1J5STX2_9ZZZZ
MDGEFLKRWSRLKRAASVTPKPAAPTASAAEPVALPAIDELDLSSDFLPFMKGEVAEGLRRAALQKLFAAEHFNVMDGLDVYVDDYNQFEPIGEEMLRQLMQARGLLSDDAPRPAAEPEANAGRPDEANDTAKGVAGEPE